VKSNFEQFETQLLAASKRAFAEMFQQADQTGEWERLLAALRRHGVNETIVRAPFSKLGWERITLNIDRSRLADGGYMEEVCAFLATEWLALLKRELGLPSVPVILQMSGQALLDCMSSLYVNEATGDTVARFALGKAADRLVSESPGVQAVMRALDGRFEIIERVRSRDSDRALAELARRTEARFAELAADTQWKFGVITDLQAARSDLLKREFAGQQEQTSDCPKCSAGPAGLNLPEPQGLYRNGHEREDLWFHEHDRELIEDGKQDEPSS
jgi:hypothetical protein